MKMTSRRASEEVSILKGRVSWLDRCVSVWSGESGATAKDTLSFYQVQLDQALKDLAYWEEQLLICRVAERLTQCPNLLD
jgi:hypothetical protein